jgi:hypothetical protein
MYYASVLLLLLIFALASMFAEVLRFGHSIAELGLIGKRFIFWAAGVRLFLKMVDIIRRYSSRSVVVA